MMSINHQMIAKRNNLLSWRYSWLLVGILWMAHMAVAAPMVTASSVASSASDLTMPTPIASNVASQPAAVPANSQHDLSVLGMYQHADIVVKIVIIGLLLASVITWALFFAKGSGLYQLRRQLRKDQAKLLPLTQWSALSQLLVAPNQQPATTLTQLYQAAENEWQLSMGLPTVGIKERSEFRLHQLIAANSHRLSQGNSYLATVGAITPFIGLFGTVWGIMNSFIGIARTQTTNLAVVAPGIAEALLATAVGLVTAIPAVVIYNIFNRSIRNYRAQSIDLAGKVLLLQARALDQQLTTSKSIYPLSSSTSAEKTTQTAKASTSQMQAG